MKAAVRHEYGPPEIVNLEEVPTPIPTEDEVLVRVHAASVNSGDWEMLTGDPLFVSVLANLFTRKPRYDVTPPNGAVTWKGGFPKVKFKILGTDIAGKVEAVGGTGKAMWQSLFLGPFISRTGNERVAFLLAGSPRADLLHMVDLFEAGKVVPVIDRCYPLSETGDAIGRLGEKQSKGKVIITT